MRASIPVLLATLAAFGAGCDDNDDNRGITTVFPDMGGPDLGGATTVRVRIAHLSPDKAPIDVCISPHGANHWMGPVLKPTGIDVNGLAYGQVTSYLTIPAGTWDVRVVDGGATSCTMSLFDATTLPALPAGASVTIAALGFVHPPQQRGTGNPQGFRLQAYFDDTTVGPTSLALRFIHASPDTPAVDAGTGSGSSFMALFTNVAFTQVGRSTTPQSDANGYAALPAPTAPPTLSVRATGTATDLLTVTLRSTPAGGTVATVFAIGDAGGSPKPLQALVCADNAPATGPLAACTAMP